METKKGKYDTNPLDPDVAHTADNLWGEGEGGGDGNTKKVQSATKTIGTSPNENARNNVYSEAPTRRYDNVNPDAPYPSVFVPPTYSPLAQQTAQPLYRATAQKPTDRTIAGIGLPEKWSVMLPYAPAYIGVVVALIELFLVPRSEGKVRFHAAQALSLHAAILLIQTVFGLVGAITGFGIGGKLFSAAATVFLIISMVRVWKGEANHIAPLSEPTEWFNEHIKPRNKT